MKPCCPFSRKLDRMLPLTHSPDSVVLYGPVPLFADGNGEDAFGNLEILILLHRSRSLSVQLSASSLE
jgi:hypothetical protein